jgi:apolipoprotein N-acyltransferase
LSKGKIDLAIIQGSTPRSGLLFNEQKMEVLNYHVAETNRLFARNSKNIDLILWPENSIDVDPFKNEVALKSIKSVLNSHGKPLLSGAVLQGEKGLSNTVLLWNPDSQTVQDSYVKSKLVPFGEYLPYREVLTKYIKRFELIPQDFIPGGEANNIAIGKAKISPIVCYEIAWNNSLFDQIEQGGQLISVHTNNATYVFSQQLDQQFMITRIRAMETAREVVVTSTTGISAHIDNRGKVLWQSKIFAPDSKVVSASLYNEITPAVRYRNEISLIGLWGWLLPMVLLVIRYFYRKK